MRASHELGLHGALCQSAVRRCWRIVVTLRPFNIDGLVFRGSGRQASHILRGH